MSRYHYEIGDLLVKQSWITSAENSTDLLVYLGPAHEALRGNEYDDNSFWVWNCETSAYYILHTQKNLYRLSRIDDSCEDS